MSQLDFATLLRRHRHLAGLSQEELARRAGLSGDAIAALERGRRRTPRPLTVRLLADALSLDDGQRAAFIALSRRASTPVPSAEAAPISRPLSAGELIGRATDLGQATRLLADSETRLLTLTGPGGVGKTRLALEVAASVQADFTDGVHWVPLGPSSDEATAAAAVGAAIGLHVPSDVRRLELLADHIGEKKPLLILDNCEHLIDTAARLCATLLRRCPRLRILATSRELLRVAGETTQPVRPLARPEATKLFAAKASMHGWGPAAADAKIIEQICQRLDGIPLAIELAAARVRIMTIEQIATELATSFGILSGGARTAPKRQQTLHAAIAWSHDLLSPDEQRFFASMSVFSGGWTIPAAQALFRGLPRAKVVDMTGRLADKSLITVHRAGRAARYDMFDVIHEFAAEQLTELGHAEQAADDHLAYVTEFAETATAHLRGDQHERWLAQLDAELDNIRAAMRRALRAQHGITALRLAAAMWRYCYLRGHYAEGRGWLESALAIYDRTHPEHTTAVAARAQALLGSGYLAFLQCEYSVAQARLAAALTTYDQLDDAAGTGLTLRYLGCVARERAAYDDAEALHFQALAIWTDRSNDAGIAWTHHHLGFVAWLREEWALAHEYSNMALERFQRLGDAEGIVWSLLNLGVVALYTGEHDTAAALLPRALELALHDGFREGVAWARNQLGVLSHRHGQLDHAVELLDESLAEHRDLGDRWRAASVLEAMAAVSQQQGQPKQAVMRLAVAATLREEIGAPVPQCERRALRRTLEAARDSLGAGLFAVAWANGQDIQLHQI